MKTLSYYLAGLLLLAGVARAQTSPLTNNPQTAIQGTLSGGSTFNTGAFTTWAFIASTLQFDVTDSTLDCGTVTPGTTAGVACNYPAGNSTAQLVVDSNADWGLTINDGFTYSTDPADANISTMTVDVPYNGTFLLHLLASNDTNGGSDPTDATPEPPDPAATVTISATYDQSTSTTDDPTKVDNYDNFGDYLGYFVVVLHER